MKLGIILNRIELAYLTASDRDINRTHEYLKRHTGKSELEGVSDLSGIDKLDCLVSHLIRHIVSEDDYKERDINKCQGSFLVKLAREFNFCMPRYRTYTDFQFSVVLDDNNALMYMCDRIFLVYRNEFKFVKPIAYYDSRISSETYDMLMRKCCYSMVEMCLQSIYNKDEEILKFLRTCDDWLTEESSDLISKGSNDFVYEVLNMNTSSIIENEEDIVYSKTLERIGFVFRGQYLYVMDNLYFLPIRGLKITDVFRYTSDCTGSSALFAILERVDRGTILLFLDTLKIFSYLCKGYIDDIKLCDKEQRRKFILSIDRSGK